MSVVKVIELIGESSESWEDAARLCVQDAKKTIRGIKSIWVKDMQAKVENDQLISFRVNCKVSFVIDEEAR
ncbi:MAG: dodecin domain-containing protein [Deltaproteobacteria bacterium]|nr:dodecin domain-containing protein [Deltaproteobacteria bacterium]